MTDASEDMERKPAEKAMLVHQVNECTILSPDMSIQELDRRLASVGLSLSDVCVKPLILRDDCPQRGEQDKAAFIKACAAVNERWNHNMASINRHKVPGTSRI